MKSRKESVVHSRKDTWPGMSLLAGSLAIKLCQPQGMQVQPVGFDVWERSLIRITISQIEESFTSQKVEPALSSAYN